MKSLSVMFLVLLVLMVSGCAIFHGELESSPESLTFKQVKVRLNVFKVVAGEKEPMELSSLERGTLQKRYKPNGIEFNQDDYDYDLSIIHKSLKRDELWKNISYFTLTIVPYWEKTKHTAVLVKRGSGVRHEYNLESAFVMNLLLFPVQIYHMFKKKNDLDSIRAKLVEAAFQDL